MKHLKMLGLAAVAAAALMAFVGAGTASATVICKTVPTAGVCPEGWAYTAGTEGTASLTAGTSARLTSGGNTIATCTGSVVKSTLKNAGSATTTVESGLSSITWSGCSQTTHTITPGRAVLHWISGTSNGTFTTLETEVTIEIFGVSCTYGAGEGTDLGTAVGGNPGFLSIATTFRKTAGGFLCPSTAGFDGQYEPTNPTAAWVAER